MMENEEVQEIQAVESTIDDADDAAFTAALFGEEEPEESGEEASAEAVSEMGAADSSTDSDTESVKPDTETVQDTENAGGGEAVLSLPVGDRVAALPAQSVSEVARSLGMPVQGVLETLQKGFAYDGKNQRELAVLQEYAEIAGMQPEQYLEMLEQRRAAAALGKEMQRVAGELPEDTPEEAVRRIAEGNLRDLRQVREQQQIQHQTQARQAEHTRTVEGWTAIMQEFPEVITDVALRDQVIAAAIARQCALPEAFSRVRAEQQTEKAEKLARELEAERKNSQNRQNAVGSMTSAGEMDSDPFLNGFMG